MSPSSSSSSSMSLTMTMSDPGVLDLWTAIRVSRMMVPMIRIPMTIMA